MEIALKIVFLLACCRCRVKITLQASNLYKGRYKWLLQISFIEWFERCFSRFVYHYDIRLSYILICKKIPCISFSNSFEDVTSSPVWGCDILAHDDWFASLWSALNITSITGGLDKRRSFRSPQQDDYYMFTFKALTWPFKVWFDL